MYTRSYYDDDKVNIPENYNGTVFEEKRGEESISEKEEDTRCHSEYTETAGSVKNRILPFGELFEKFNLKGVLSDLKFPLSIKNHKWDFEDLLIVALAAYLLFSRDGDKECGIILIILLFIM